MRCVVTLFSVLNSSVLWSDANEFFVDNCSNSINDLAASITIAKDGYASMAIAGAYAGPMFNILAGIGLPMLMFTANDPSHEYNIGKPTPLVWLAFTTLLISLIVTLVWVPLAGWRITHKIGRFLCGWFFLYILIVVIVGCSGLSPSDNDSLEI
jgi:sodium/potassium/calcium exchanger 6